MSIKLMSEVWEKSPYEGSTLLVHLSLADHANDDGICWPSYSRLAKKARISERHAITVVKRIVNDGYVIKNPRYTDDGEQTSNYYLVLPPGEVLEKHPGVIPSSPPSDPQFTPPVIPSSPLGVIPSSPDPSLLTSNEPSINVNPDSDQVAPSPEEKYRQETREAMARSYRNQESLEGAYVRLFRKNLSRRNKEHKYFTEWVKGLRDPVGKLERFAKWWFENDWRGKLNQSPTPSQIMEFWPQVFPPNAPDPVDLKEAVKRVADKYTKDNPEPPAGTPEQAEWLKKLIRLEEQTKRQYRR